MTKKTRHYELNASYCSVKFSPTNIFKTDVPVESVIHTETFEEFKNLLRTYLKDMKFDKIKYENRSIYADGRHVEIIYSATGIDVFEDDSEEYSKLTKNEDEEIKELLNRHNY